jgi:hypothetical protein
LATVHKMASMSIQFKRETISNSLWNQV